MTKMTKGAFGAMIENKMTNVSGYLFELLLTDGTVKHMGVYENKVDGRWDVIDVATGLSLTHSTTRKDAVARAESEPVVKKFTELVNSEKYAKMRARGVAGKVEKATGEKVEVKVEKVMTGKKPPKAPAKPRKAPAKPKKQESTKEGSDMEKRIAELEAKLKATEAAAKMWQAKAEEYYSAKAEPPEPKAESPKAEVASTAEAVSLAEMKAWCEGKGLVASQKAEGCCIWVEGESKPYADELKGKGFRFARKRKSWYLDPKRIA